VAGIVEVEMKEKAKISQVALVVRDLEKTMKAYHDLLGWGPWNVYEHVPPLLHDTHVRGAAVKYTMLAAETDVHGVGFEMVQPLDGPSIYKEWLETHGEGFHHIAVMMHSQAESDAFKKEMAGLGIVVLMGGRIGPTIEYYYLETTPVLKVIFESGSGHAIDLKPTRVYP
jgi:methylmalonyl-CoA/ethylmalonyl-CoA epimerase